MPQSSFPAAPDAPQSLPAFSALSLHPTLPSPSQQMPFSLPPNSSPSPDPPPSPIRPLPTAFWLLTRTMASGAAEPQRRSFETLRVMPVQGRVLHVELNRPEKRNAMNVAFWRYPPSTPPPPPQTNLTPTPPPHPPPASSSALSLQGDGGVLPGHQPGLVVPRRRHLRRRAHLLSR